MHRPLLSHVSARWRTLAACGVLSIAAALARPAPPDAGLAALAGALGEAVGQNVEPDDIRWEPSGGALADAALGRFALFLASEQKGGPRDVWRARVRVTPEGRVLAVVDAHDLTATPLGDDHALVVRGRFAAFATHAFGQEQSVTLLDLAGEGAQNATAAAGDRAMSWITNVQTTGAGAGIARVDVTLDEPASRVGVTLRPDALVIDLADDSGSSAPARARRAELDLARLELTNAAPGMHAEGARHLPKRFVFWAVDTVRAVPWIGPAPIAWLEDKVFAVRDFAHKMAFKLGGADAAQTLAQPEGAPAADAPGARPAGVLDASQASADAAQWPPPPIRSIWQRPEPGEGEWAVPRLPWSRKLLGTDPSAPAPFYRTFVRPDEERPYERVLLVAMDMRQLELGMEAGVEDPKPLTGAHGSGRIPRDPAIYPRVVAAYNGAFKTEHGSYGMMVNRRVLLPPQPGAASVIVLKDSRVGLGTWGAARDVSGLRGVADGDILSFRQNLDPLLDGGEINPTKRALWGYTLPGSGTQTERSGLCVTGAGHLVYAWGEEVSATVLAKAMRMGGCVYGMHLDMNPHHTGFLFANITELKGHNYRTELLAPKMEISLDRYIEYTAKDFFYVMLHDPSPPPLSGGAAWQPDRGVQPAPAWMPGIWSVRTSDGIEIVDVEPGRATWRVRAGRSEPDAKTGGAPARELADEDAHKVLLAVALGHATERHPKGLATDGRQILPMSASATGALVASADGRLTIERASGLAPISAHADAVELPLLLDDGVLVPPHGEPHKSGDPARAALGTTADGRVLVARAPVSFALLADALKRAGCTRAVALDRGAPAAASVLRSGTPEPPRARYEETTLSAIAVPLKPRGFRFEAETKMAQAGAPR